MHLEQQLAEVGDPGVGSVGALGGKEQSFVDKVPLLFAVGPTALSAERLGRLLCEVIDTFVYRDGFELGDELIFASLYVLFLLLSVNSISGG